MARGGPRPGSGPKKGTKYKPRASKTEPKNEIKGISSKTKKTNLLPLTYMLQVMNDPDADDNRRDRMAQAAAPFVHARADGTRTKKDEASDRAKKAGAGKFKSSDPPMLKAVK